jgi:hypothetical protein
MISNRVCLHYAPHRPHTLLIRSHYPEKRKLSTQLATYHPGCKAHYVDAFTILIGGRRLRRWGRAIKVPASICGSDFFFLVERLEQMLKHNDGKASLAETFFQKLFGKRRAVKTEGWGTVLEQFSGSRHQIWSFLGNEPK